MSPSECRLGSYCRRYAGPPLTGSLSFATVYFLRLCGVVPCLPFTSPWQPTHQRTLLTFCGGSEYSNVCVGGWCLNPDVACLQGGSFMWKLRIADVPICSLVWYQFGFSRCGYKRMFPQFCVRIFPPLYHLNFLTVDKVLLHQVWQPCVSFLLWYHTAGAHPDFFAATGGGGGGCWPWGYT
jgi:hypothetical protein